MQDLGSRCDRQAGRMDDWDALAATFDEEADHGLRDPSVRAAWNELLLSVLPESARTVADIGCGTGTLSVLLARQGREVTGVDLSARMLAEAERKSAELPEHRPAFVQGDAVAPPLPPAGFDVVLARHILFLLPEPAQVLGRWLELLRPGGVLVLIEGFWSTGAGMPAETCVELVRRHRTDVRVEQLADRVELWGGAVDDERYLLVSAQ